MDLTRRQLMAGAAATTAAAGLGSALSAAPAGASPSESTNYLVGCGIGDVTGAVAGQGMMGYSNPEQVAAGLLQRCWARAYIIADPATGQRVVFLTADLACLFQSHHMGLMAKLRNRFGALYTESNVNLNAQHTHASCGGTSWDYAYSLAAFGFKKNSYDAEIDGMFAAIVRAHENLAPGSVTIGREELHDASRNRSRVAFDANPSADKRHFPDAIDPQVTVLRLRQHDTSGGRDVGAITWFPTHGTSLTDRNVLIAGDNKGYASHLWERTQPGFVAAFPQTNSGDMTPNLALAQFDPRGPTSDNRRNCELIGERQYVAGRRGFEAARPMTRGGVDSIVRYVDMSAVRISGTYTPDGRPASTTPAMMGAGAVATSSEDNYEQPLPFLVEGMTNPLVTALGGDRVPPIAPWMRDMQAPKLIAFPLGLLPPSGWIPSVVPLQLMRIGELVLVAVPAEVTVVAGLRLRQVVADELRTDVDNVLVQGFANAYTQYVTTPEEYDLQHYEGGETQFGRYTLSAYLQEFAALAAAMSSGRRIGRGPAPVDKSALQPDLVPPVPADRPIPGRRYGDVLREPDATYRPGSTVTVQFVGAHPNNDFRHGRTYLEVQRRTGSEWTTVADDNDWSTEFRWARPSGSTDTSRITITWRSPTDASGMYRIRYFGDSRDANGSTRPVSGTSRTFRVGSR